MTLSYKSMRIRPLEHCFWRKKSCKMGTEQATKSITHCPSTTFKTRSYLAYLQQDTGLLTNTLNMKRLVVKKIQLFLSA